MQLSGHKNVQSTYNYSHLSQKTMEKYVKNIEWPDFNSSNWNTLLSKQRNNKVKRRRQQGYSRMLCFTEEISTSSRPRLQQKHINNKLIEE